MSDDEDIDVDVDIADNDEDQEEKIELKVLDSEMLALGLSVLGRSGNGLEHAFVRLDVQGKELTDIAAVESCVHLRYINADTNFITDLSPLNKLPELCSLSLANNKLEILNLEPRTYLQVADFSSNNLSQCSDLEQPMLKKLNLSGNQINDPGDLKQMLLPMLQQLELKENGIMSIETIGLQSLTQLSLDGNNLETLNGIGTLINLQQLSCRSNQIKSLAGFSPSQDQLAHIDCSENGVVSLLEVAKLGVLPALKILLFGENGVADDPEYRAETLIAIGQLDKLDDEPFEEEERIEATTKREQRAAEAKEREARARQEGGQEDLLQES